MGKIEKVTKPKFIWKHEFLTSTSLVFKMPNKVQLDYVHASVSYDTFIHSDVISPIGSRQINVSLYASSALTTSNCICKITGSNVLGNVIEESIDHSNYTFSAGETRTLESSKIYSSVKEFQFNFSQPAGLYMKLGIDKVIGADLAAESYYIRGDNGSDCLLREIKSKMNAEIDISNFATSINGEGKVLISNSVEQFILLLNTAPNWTDAAFDYSILGYDTTSDTASSLSHQSTYQHKRGWYPDTWFETDSKDYSVGLTRLQRSLTNKMRSQRLSLLTFRDVVIDLISSKRIFKDETFPTNFEISFEEFWDWCCQNGEFLYYRDCSNLSLDGKYLIRDADRLNEWIPDYTTDRLELYRIILEMIKYVE